MLYKNVLTVMIIHCKIFFVFLFSWFGYNENFQIYSSLFLRLQITAFHLRTRLTHAISVNMSSKSLPDSGSRVEGNILLTMCRYWVDAANYCIMHGPI